ncbi:SxtJ family membrane protein [Thiohalocapsa halophila]
MTTHDIPELDAAGLRRFALTTAAIVAALFGVLLPWLGGFGWPLWPWGLALLLALWGLIRPAGLRPVYRGWMRFGLLASRIMTPLVLGLVFFLLFLPIGLVMRLAGHDPMRRKLDPDAATYRVPSRPQPPDSIEKPY